MLNNFNDGKSRTFFCRAAALLDLKNLEKSLNRAARKIKTDKIKKTDVKSKAKILKEIISETASNQGIELVKKK